MIVGLDKSFTLAQIADRTALPIEQLRYVIDTLILKGRRCLMLRTPASKPGRGIPRRFTGMEAFSIASQAFMLQAGIRRRVIQDCMKMLSASIDPNSRRAGDVLLVRVFYDKAVVAIEIGDGCNFRLIQQADLVNKAIPEGWLQAKTGARVEGYDPLLVVRINLAKLRSYFR